MKIVGNGHQDKNLNRRASIHKKCLDCSGWHPGDVTGCPFESCALHPFRTGKGKQSPRERNKAIRGYCLRCMNGQAGEVTKCSSTGCFLFAYRKGGLDRTLISPSFKKIIRIGGEFSLKRGMIKKSPGAIQLLKKTRAI